LAVIHAMNHLVLLPLVVPFVAAVAAFLVRRRPLFQRTLGLAGSGGVLLAALVLIVAVWRHGVHVLHIGGWPAPFGITLVADLFSALMVALAGVIGFLVTVYSLISVDARRASFGYYPLLLILLMGVCGAFLTGDLFNLYVWFEVLLMASFALLTLGGERGQIEGGFKYVTLNLIASTLFLTALGLVYGMTGTLNMAALARSLPAAPYPGLLLTVSMLFLVGFGIKAAVFPLFFWLPASYHTPPVAVSAVFVGLLTKVGVYALVRLFTLLFTQDTAFTHALILVLAGCTMVTGVLGAVAQNEFRRILSFHSISQVGYMLMGLGLFTPLALAGALYFMIHHSVVKTNLFLVSGVVYDMQGSYELKRLGGQYRAFPALAALFLVSALSLAGVPPFSGFFAKLSLVQAGLALGHYGIVGVSLAVGALTLLSMAKVWAEVFWKAPPTAPGAGGAVVHVVPRGRLMVLLTPVVVLALTAVLMGVLAEPVLALVTRAADQLLDPAEYINRVLGI
jgi:multicomponent Na+:H+ antiporter subunit D